jgi:hypothetical protein
MAQIREQEFYQTKRQIIECADEDLNSIKELIVKFFKKINTKQCPENYESTKNLEQFDVDKLIKAKKQQTLVRIYFNEMQLIEVFQRSRQNGNMFCISHLKSYRIDGEWGRHTIAVYVRGQNYYCYDANYSTGEAKVFSSANALAKEIQNCLFDEFKIRIPFYIPLEIKLVLATDLFYKHSPFGFYSNPSKKRNLEQLDEVQDNDRPIKKRKLNQT